MAENKTPELRSLQDVLEKRLEKDELDEINRMLYGKPLG